MIWKVRVSYPSRDLTRLVLPQLTVGSSKKGLTESIRSNIETKTWIKKCFFFNWRSGSSSIPWSPSFRVPEARGAKTPTVAAAALGIVLRVSLEIRSGSNNRKANKEEKNTPMASCWREVERIMLFGNNKSRPLYAALFDLNPAMLRFVPDRQCDSHKEFLIRTYRKYGLSTSSVNHSVTAIPFDVFFPSCRVSGVCSAVTYPGQLSVIKPTLIELIANNSVLLVEFCAGLRFGL